MAQSFPEKLGSALLARNGIAAVRQLCIAAAGAYRHGRLDTAETLVRMADAAERESHGCSLALISRNIPGFRR
jgi:hypothetical protein